MTAKTRGSEPASVRQIATQALAQQGVLSDDLLEHKTLGERTRYRQQLLLQQQQQNIEQVAAVALSHCSGKDAGSALDPDWLRHFIQLAETTYNPQMQALWGKILAEESRFPGYFSLKSLDTLRGMTTKEALHFQKLCALRSTWGSGGKRVLIGWLDTPHWWQWRRDNAETLSLSKHGLPYSVQMTLTDIGLLHPSELESGELAQEPMALNINGQRLIIKPKREGIRLVYYRFTPVGDELSQLLPDAQRQTYIEELRTLLEPAFEIK
ncbi:TIGR03899 family protein [Corallincola platygyrae]|uniref:TIGR03899 family protein n=1 Tax=Corallincola platygyrae TaxID=1193278 RepID=A0ABW4XLG9_9GAMM